MFFIKHTEKERKAISAISNALISKGLDGHEFLDAFDRIIQERGFTHENGVCTCTCDTEHGHHWACGYFLPAGKRS